MAKNLNVSLLLDAYGELLNEKQRNVAEYYYNDDLSLSEISENEGITRQGVYDIIKRTEQLLNEFENKLHLCEFKNKLKKAAAENDTDAVIELIDNF